MEHTEWQKFREGNSTLLGTAPASFGPVDVTSRSLDVGRVGSKPNPVTQTLYNTSQFSAMTSMMTPDRRKEFLQLKEVGGRMDQSGLKSHGDQYLMNDEFVQINRKVIGIERFIRNTPFKISEDDFNALIDRNIAIEVKGKNMYYINKTYTAKVKGLTALAAAKSFGEGDMQDTEFTLTPGTVFIQGLDGNFWNTSVEKTINSFFSSKLRRVYVVGTHWVADPITTTRGGATISTSSKSITDLEDEPF